MFKEDGVNEPQSVTELMDEARRLWRRQADHCTDDTAVERRDLADQVAVLADEYGEADYTRREDIEKTLRGLLARHAALPPLAVPEPDPEPIDAAPEPEMATGPEPKPTVEPISKPTEPQGDMGPAPSRGGATGGLGETVSRWSRWAYGQVDYQVLCRKREVRLSELGGRIHDLANAGRLHEVTEDEGVRRILAQVDEVDAAIAANREQISELREV